MGWAGLGGEGTTVIYLYIYMCMIPYTNILCIYVTSDIRLDYSKSCFVVLAVVLHRQQMAYSMNKKE